MSNVFVDKNKIDLLANAISAKSGESLTLTLDEMVEAVDGIESGGGGITPTGNINITQAGVTDVTNYATATVPQGEMSVISNREYYTENGQRKWRYRGEGVIDTNDGEGTPGFIADGTYVYGSWNPFNAVAKNTTVTPTTSSQTIGGTNYMMEGAVTVSAMPSGTAGTPTATKGTVSNHSVSVTPSVTNTTGYITGSTKTGTAVTVSASELASGSKYITSNGTDIDVVGYSTVDVDVPPPPLGVVVSGTGNVNNCYVLYDDTKYYGSWTPIDVRSLSSVTIHYSGTLYYNGEPYESSGTYKDTDITIAKNTTIELHYGDAQRTVDIWEEITPYDTETFTTNGTYNVYADKEITVNVSGGGGSSKNAQVVQGTTRTTSSTLTAIGAEMTVSKTGTYNVYWSAFRSNTSSQYTFATKLYINGTGYGSEQTTWSNHQQNVHLSNVSLSANDKIRVYGRESRGSSYYMYAGTLTIVEA